MSSTPNTGGDTVIGIFVGGRGRRLGGIDKGQLITDSGQTILSRLVEVASSVAPAAVLMLIGDSPSEAGVLQHLPDDPPNRGPLGGLSALLLHARTLKRRAVALASDLPGVSPALLGRLLRESPEAGLLAPRLDGIFQPFFARYEPEAILPLVEQVLASSRASLLGVFERAEVTELSLDEGEQAALRDWDEPADLPAHLRGQLPSPSNGGTSRSNG